MRKFLLLIALIISVWRLNAQSVGDNTYIKYDGYSLEFTITSVSPPECGVIYCTYTTSPTAVTIPASVEIGDANFNVTSIENIAFSNRLYITSIEIPSSVTSIGESAFYGCSNLINITFGENSLLTSIERWAFQLCTNLASIEIPNSVISIGEGVFNGCSSLTNLSFKENSQLSSIGYNAFGYCSSLTSIEIPNSVTSIGSSAFSGCSSLLCIEIPSSVISIGESVFGRCDNLETIIIDAGNTIYDSRNNCNAIIKSSTNELIAGCQNTIIPNTVTSIGDDAFRGCSSLTSIEIPSSVTSIGTGAFTSCSSLENVILEENSQLISIGGYAFEYCSSLINIIIPNGVSSIEDQTFLHCDALTNIIFASESSLTCIGKLAFAYTMINTINIPDKVTTIKDYAFSNCEALTSIKCHAEEVPTTGSDVFYSCPSDMTIYVPASSVDAYLAASPWENYTIVALPEIGDNTIINYDGYSLKFTITDVSLSECEVVCETKPTTETAIAIPSTATIEGLECSVTSIGAGAFTSCSSLTSIEIPNSVTSIGDDAFNNCPSLTSIEIPSGVTSIGDWAFAGCSGLESMTVEDGNTAYDSRDNCNAIIESSTNKLIAGCKNTIIPDDVTSIGIYAFYGCDGFTGIEIPSSVTSIGASAFEECSSLTSIEIPSGVTSIGSFAFAYCEALSSIKCHAEAVPSTDITAFYDCPSDMTIQVPAGSVEAYQDASPWKNYNIVALPEIGDNTIINYDGYSLKYTVTNVSPAECEVVCETKPTSPTAITIPSTVTVKGVECSITSIGNYAFENCSNLTSIEIPGSVISIGNYVFDDCTSLTDLYLLDGDNELNLGYGDWEGEEELFVDCPLNIIYLGRDLSFYGYYEFAPFQQTITTLTIGNSVTEFDELTFYGCHINNLHILSLTEWCEIKFYSNPMLNAEKIYINNSLVTDLFIPADVTIVNEGAIIGSKFNSLAVSSNNHFYDSRNNCNAIIETSTNKLISGCNNTIIPLDVTSIEKNAFESCSSLTSIEIPSNVTSIRDGAFYDCSSLNNVYIYRITPATLGSSVFPSNVSTIYVPSTALNSYINTTNWSSYSTKIEGMPTYTLEGWIAADGTSSYTPSSTDDVVLNEHLTLSSGTKTNDILTINTLSFTENGRLTIEDGAQLIANKVVGNVTVKKTIEGYSQQPTAKSQSSTQWYSISSPLKGNVTATSITNLIDATTPANYALYRYDEPRFTWENYKYLDNNFTTLDAGRGYLYANAEDVTLEFTGAVNTDDVEYILTADAPELTGFHLVGNPFTYNITFEHLSSESNILVQGYYLLDGDGGWAATPSTTGDIKHSQGILIKTTADGTLTISPKPTTSKGQQPTANSQQPMLSLNVTNSNYSDRAFVIFGEGVGLDKINHENKDIPMLYIPMSDADYAIAMIDDNVSEIPVGFESSSMGEFTISLRHENCEFEELYLLDKETGAKIDILEQDYTFMATSGDNPERFTLIKSQGSQPEAQSNFAYINNGDVVIYGAEGNAHIDIYDVLGRRVYNTNGSDDVHILTTDGYSAGVYVIRLMDEKGLRTQKVIID